MAARRPARERRSKESPRPSRLETGIAGLDRVLCGGLIRGGLYLLAGPPGSGKTVLANQICFDVAKRGQLALYVTLLTESHGRMVENVSSFPFFDRKALGRSVVYVSGYRELRDAGLDGLRSVVEHEIHQSRPTVVVLDGVAAMAEAAASNADFRLFLNKLRVQLELHAATGVLCLPSPATEQEATQTMADGVIVLAQRHVTRLTVRELEVVKFRGSSHMTGRHVFEIDARGVTVYPRSEAWLGRSASDARDSADRAAFGVPVLDEMLRGGVPASSLTAVIGAPGSGKTTLGIQFLAAGAKRRENGLYFGFYESPERLLVQADGFGIPLRRMQDQRRIEVCWTPPYENLADPLLLQILERARGGDLRRVFIDGLDGLTKSVAFADRIPALMSALSNELRALHVTTVVSVESPMIGEAIPQVGPESAFAENVILLHHVDLRAQARRLLSIVKVRGSDFDASIREFAIGAGGIALHASAASARTVADDTSSAGVVERAQPRNRSRGRRS